MNSKKKPSELVEGDWFELSLAWGTREFCVFRAQEDCVVAGTPEHITSLAERYEHKTLEENAGYRFIEHTKRRWWWRWIPFRWMFFPFPHPKTHWWK